MRSYIIFFLLLTTSGINSMESSEEPIEQMEQKLTQLESDYQGLENILRQSSQIKANKKIRSNPNLVMKHFAQWQIKNPQGTLAQYYIFLNDQAVMAEGLPFYERQKRALAKKINVLESAISRQKARPEMELNPRQSTKSKSRI